MLARDSSPDLDEHVTVAPERSFLDTSLMPGVRGQDLFIVEVHAMRPEQVAKSVDDPGLPVDQGAVAVEGKGLESAEVKGHGARLPHRGGAARDLTKVGLKGYPLAVAPGDRPSDDPRMMRDQGLCSATSPSSEISDRQTHDGGPPLIDAVWQQETAP